MAKMSVKRLTASDLTFFEWHFQNRNAGNQKAINLNADVFIQELFPSLPEIAAAQSGRLPVDLFLYGPGLHTEMNLQRKIVKFGSYKNWRLDGEFVYNPTDAPTRFNVLVPNDFVVIDFVGDAIPDAARAYFLAANDQADSEIHRHLDTFMDNRKMVSISRLQIATVLDHASPRDDHPLRSLLIDRDLEDAAQGGEQALYRLQRRSSVRRVSRDDLLKARARAEEVGQLGEEYVNAYLAKLKAEGRISEFEWVAMADAVSPYDFWAMDAGSKRLLDVKSTSGEFGRPLHVSMNELRTIAESTERYDVYRIYEATDISAKLRISEGLRPIAESILGVLNSLPAGTTADGVSISPDRLTFGAEVQLAELPTDDEDAG